MKYKDALRLAEKVKTELAPYCERVEIAGDIRGKRQDINEIIIVAIPKQYDIGTLKVIYQWENVDEELENNYMHCVLPEGIRLDLCFADKENWGFTFAFNTANAEYFYRDIAAGFSIYDIEFIGNHIYKDGKKIPLYEEEDLFNIIQKPYVEPELRYYKLDFRL